MRNLRSLRLVTVIAVGLAMVLGAGRWQSVKAGGVDGSGYRVLKPIQSGDLTLFPVVRAEGKTPPADQFLTLDEGLKSSEVEVTEAGRVRGLVRSRGGSTTGTYQGDQVNTLVLVNNAKLPLLLLAGEIVTGGKQDRIIAKDRIVPVGAQPIDLSVFCIEHGRWTESSSKFGTSANAAASFMVQPAVRQQAMVAKSQQQVWDSVSGAITTMAAAAAPPMAIRGTPERSLSAPPATRRRCRPMRSAPRWMKRPPERPPPASRRSRSFARSTAVGVVVALRGEVIWADIFSDTGPAHALLDEAGPVLRSRRPGRLSFTRSGHDRRCAALPRPANHRQGRVRRRSRRLPGARGEERRTDLFALESLLPGTGYDVHVSRLKLKGGSLVPIYR